MRPIRYSMPVHYVPRGCSACQNPCYSCCGGGGGSYSSSFSQSSSYGSVLLCNTFFKALRLKMDCLKFTSLTVGVLCIIINLSYCQERKYNSLNTGNLNDSTPVLKSIVDSNASITEDVYKLIPEIEEELNKLTRDEFKHFLEKVLLRLKNDYNMILEVYRNITLEEEEEKDNSNNSTLIKRVKRTFKKKQPYCNSCQQGYGQSSFVVPIPVFVKPSYYGQGGCQGGCGNQRPSYPQCNTCGGGGYGGGGYGGGYGGPPSGSYSQSSSSAQSSSMSFGG